MLATRLAVGISIDYDSGHYIPFRAALGCEEFIGDSAMSTGLVYDGAFQKHIAGPGNPERPDRLAAIVSALDESGLIDRCVRIPARPIDPQVASRVHGAAYLERLQRACAAGESMVDCTDCGICPETWDVALLAAGSVLQAVDAVMEGRVSNAFCAIRPPGHHAERDFAMGFCFLSNVVLAVDHLRHRHGIGRILIFDWDVHHGNGTQHLLEQDPQAMFISIHGHPHYVYPGTGFAEERGTGPGLGATLNVPMMPMSGDKEYRVAFDRHVRNVLESFPAEFVLISCGFDAHRRDPLAPLNLETESFEWMTSLLMETANHHCNGRLVSVLEGGYDLQALADCTRTHVSTLLG